MSLVFRVLVLERGLVRGGVRIDVIDLPLHGVVLRRQVLDQILQRATGGTGIGIRDIVNLRGDA